MDFVDRAKVRLEHWILHNEQHLEDYERFAEQLEEAGKKKSAGYMWEMKELSAKSNECLRKALKALE